ncbi:MAG: Holliday junction branch migration protein RuvA [Bacteroidota bacterium]
MIDYIEGKIAEITPTYVVIDVNGMGFSFNISLNTFSEIRENTKCKLYAHLAFKNEASTPVGMVLYGFATISERTMFHFLVSVSGVGANTARLILSSMTASEVQQVIVSGNVALLQKVKGIGGKTAQRIIVDLKDKLSKESIEKDYNFAASNTVKEEALGALVMLGFMKNIAEKTVDKIIKEHQNSTVEEIIKLALKML